MAVEPDSQRVRSLEEQVRDLQAVHGQLVAYAEDLNRTYVELRFRLQQMTELGSLAARLARARSIETLCRTCAEGITALLPHAVGRVYLEDRKGVLRVAARERGPLNEARDILLDNAASDAVNAETPLIRRINDPDTGDFHIASAALRTRGKAFGVLVASRLDQPFAQDDTQVIELLASNTAVAIANARLIQESRKLATHDATTGLYNFRYFRTALAQEIQKARRFKYPIAILMADIDHFKQFNDTYGHPKGNIALNRIAQCLKRGLRQTDTVARFGGEEFAAILPGCDREALAHVAEKIRSSVSLTPIRLSGVDDPTHLTISLGGAWRDASEADPQALLSAADEALYTAKAMGRDRTYIRP